jgi:hypothetical protein
MEPPRKHSRIVLYPNRNAFKQAGYLISKQLKLTRQINVVVDCSDLLGSKAAVAAPTVWWSALNSKNETLAYPQALVKQSNYIIEWTSEADIKISISSFKIWEFEKSDLLNNTSDYKNSVDGKRNLQCNLY